MTFNSSKISNGLTVLSFNMPFLQSVAINLIINIGSRFESPEEAGLSHFLEHMVFKGTGARSAKDIAEEFDSIGGYFNAYTSREHTVYHAKLLPGNFAQGMEILADIIQNSLFEPADIEKEYQVICQEIAQVQDNPDDLAFEKLYEVAYPAQPLGKSILGTNASIAAFNRDSFKRYIGRYYTTGNMYLSVAGNITHEEVHKKAQELFSSLPYGLNKEITSAKYYGGYNISYKELEQTTLVISFESIPYLNLPKFYHAQILSLILGGGISSRLFQQIRENLGLAYSVGAYNSGYYDNGLFSIYASTNPQKTQLLADNLINELKKIISNITEKEMLRAYAQIKASIYMAEEKSSYKSEEIGKNFAIFGRYLPSEEILEYVMTSKASDITNIAEKIFASSPSVSIVGPKGSEVVCDKIDFSLSR